jgi:hypothetical protein
MRTIMRILALPFTSETVATGIGGLGIIMMLLPTIYYMLAIRLTEGLSQIVILAAIASTLPLSIACASLWLGSGFRSYRDNTKSRWACELFSLMFLMLTLQSIRMHTI